MNTIRLKKFSFKKQLSTLDRNIDKSKYILKRIRSSTRYVHIVQIINHVFYIIRWEINAFPSDLSFLTASNTVILQSGALHELFFDVTFPPAFNFGTTAYGIGHEIAHGFTDIGLLYDSNGHKRQWLNNATTQRLQKSSECFIDQYSNYSIGGYTINGKKTLCNLNQLPIIISSNLNTKNSFESFSGIQGKTQLTMLD